MASPNSKKSLYPEVDLSNPEVISSAAFPSSSSLYPSIETKDLAENLFPDNESEAEQRSPNSKPQDSQPASFESLEEVLIRVPGTIVHLIDKQQSIELASGELTIVRLRQGENVVAVLARIGDEIQWPLAKDEAAVKLDESHYFFSLRVPGDARSDEEDRSEVGEDDENLLNYGLTIASKGQEGLLDAFDGVLEHYSAFSVQKVSAAVDGSVAARETSPEEMAAEGKKKMLVEGSSAAYWTTLAPNVEDYSSGVARMIAAGSAQLIRGILWCGDVTVDRLNWGDEILKKRLGQGSNAEISPQAMKRMKRVKRMTKMSEKVATGILSGVVKVSGFFTSSIVNSSVGKKFFSLLPGEIVLASLDGFTCRWY
ncbi:protein EARLY-RESPONSIVE TO DEHYDRATION 7, chloroplastic-like isoform X2 [Diospyros lotus]|uniref:protein EARLY-RESPONSIVE TO DEHYDRATION 7, chloroplastic-like isoform X2 n=1 Tax=Diospyros lotus TaxID=55363 RepID=UPI0022598A8E|nr:protein EARLY-RESPONSIVE TO DEHYDRATION 7, chloroplastic-like isoform X2 [Diospyros lotus]